MQMGHRCRFQSVIIVFHNFQCFVIFIKLLKINFRYLYRHLSVATANDNGKNTQAVKTRVCKIKNLEDNQSIIDYYKKQWKNNIQKDISPHSPSFQQLLDQKIVLIVLNISFGYASNYIQTDMMAVNNVIISDNDNVVDLVYTSINGVLTLLIRLKK